MVLSTVPFAEPRSFQVLHILSTLSLFLLVGAWNQHQSPFHKQGRSVSNRHRHCHHRGIHNFRNVRGDSSAPSSLQSAAHSIGEGMSTPTLSYDVHDASAESLENLAKLLVDNNVKREKSQRISVCLAIAGGGGNAISALAATPGASSVLLEGCVTYDRKSYQNYVQLPPAMTNFQYASMEAAKTASEAALQKALQYRCSNVRQMTGCVGVGCASTLRSLDSDEEFEGHGNLAVTIADGSQLFVNITMASEKTRGFGRSRLDEDVLLSHVILSTINKVLKMGDAVAPYENDFSTQFGDKVTERWVPWGSEGRRNADGGSSESEQIESSATAATATAAEEEATLAGHKKAQAHANGNAATSDSAIGRMPRRDVPTHAAKRIISGDCDAVILIPMYENGKAKSFRALHYSFLPHGSIVFPGSFNPPHQGHLSLASAAVEHRTNSQRRIDPTAHRRELAVFMELSIANADKPSIDPEVVSERLRSFLSFEELPTNWGILLTRAPLFSKKVEVLSNCIPQEEIRGSHEGSPMMSFVIGTDTLVRLIDPKYYGNDRDEMLEALGSMMNQGVRFIVGGRLEQRKDVQASEKFVSGFDEVDRLPTKIRAMFSIIKENEFRVDISSSEIRSEQLNGNTTS